MIFSKNTQVSSVWGRVRTSPRSAVEICQGARLSFSGIEDLLGGAKTFLSYAAARDEDSR